MLARARVLTELGLLGYLLTIPVGPALTPWARDVALFAILAGMVGARLPGAPPAPPFRLLVPLVLFALSTGVSTLLSTHAQESLARAAYAPIGFLVFLATQEVATTPPAFRRILLVLAVVVVALGADGVHQFATGASLLGGTLPFRGRISGSLPHPNDLALIPILLPAALSVVEWRRRHWTIVLLVVGVPLALATVILSQSRNAWLGLAVGLGALALARRHRPLVAGVALAAAALFVLAWAFDVGNVAQRARKILDTPREPRIGHWLVAWRMFTESPLIGKGVHTFGEFYLPYLEKVHLPATITPEVAYIPWAHNLYLEVLAERGVLGAIAFTAALGGMARILARTLGRRTRHHPIAPAVGLTGGLAAFLAQAVFDLTFLKDWVLLVFWLLAALVARLPLVAEAPDASAAGPPSDELGEHEATDQRQ